MAEPERVRIRIRGTQKDAEGAVQHTETQAVARHDGKGGKHYLRYEDRTLLAGQAVPSLLAPRRRRAAARVRARGGAAGALSLALREYPAHRAHA